MPEYKKGTPWLVLTPEMKQFEKTTEKKAVYRGRITGQFEYWLWQQQNKKTKPRIEKPSMEEILTEARKGPDEFLEWSKKSKIKLKVAEIEKDYRNLKLKSKTELWRIYGRSHKVYSEDKQMSKSAIISFILNDRYTRKELEQWDPPKQKPKKQLTQTPELYIVRRQSVPTTSKKDKQWRIYVKIGKEKVYIALENGSQSLIRLDGDKTMLRTHLKWRYSINYNSDGIAKALNVKSIEYKYIKRDSGYFVSNITDVVVDKMNMLAKHTGSKSRFSMPIKKSK